MVICTDRPPDLISGDRDFYGFPSVYTSTIVCVCIHVLTTNLRLYQINRLQHIQNALARTVVQAPKFQHITPILKSLHWLKVSERIEYRIISLTCKTLNTTQPPYIDGLVSIQPPHGQNTRSSPYWRKVIKAPSSSLKVTHRSFRHASPHLWNQLPKSLRIFHPNYSPPLSYLNLNIRVELDTHCYHLLSLFHCFTLSSKPIYLFRKCYPPPSSADSMTHGGPHFYKWLGTGGTVSRRTANKKLTKLYWPSR